MISILPDALAEEGVVFGEPGAGAVEMLDEPLGLLEALAESGVIRAELVRVLNGHVKAPLEWCEGGDAGGQGSVIENWCALSYEGAASLQDFDLTSCQVVLDLGPLGGLFSFDLQQVELQLRMR